MGKPTPELDPPEFPESLAYLWHFYLSLRMGLGTDMTGLAPMSWVSLDAWTRLTGNVVEPREADALFYLDAAFRNPDPKTK